MKKAVQFGAGNIGRGFIGAVLAQSGYHVVFADVNDAVIQKINEDKSYTVFIKDVVCSECKITNISAVSSASEAIYEQIKEASLLTTAVGLMILPRIAPTIAKGICKRMEACVREPLNIIACENAVRASSQLKEAVYAALPEAAKTYCDTYVGFPDCSVDRIVPPVKSDNFIDVVVEKYFEWNVEEAAFCGAPPHIEGMHLAGNLMAYIERKLFTLNTGHCITAYLGYLKGYQTIEQSIQDPSIFAIVKAAMEESGAGLIKKYAFDAQTHAKYIEKIIGRFQNPYLQDDVARVGREPLRKLSDSDRLIKPLLTARGYALPVAHLIEGVGAALHYDNAEDPQSVTLQNDIKALGIKATLTKVTGITEDELLKEMEQAYTKLA